jgi:hypothetical protein
MLGGSHPTYSGKWVKIVSPVKFMFTTPIIDNDVYQSLRLAGVVFSILSTIFLAH